MRGFLWLLPLVLLGLIPAAAQARARDDATSGAYRCAVIGELRPWLDCFYGAAQPARAQLNLPPAPAAQIRLALSPPAGNAPAADLRLREEVMASVLRCYAISSDRQWLDCYYGAAQPVRARLGLAPGPQAPALAAQGIAQGPVSTADDQFGLAGAAGARKVDHITARMTSYSFSPFKIFTVSLANGQVWRQLSGDITYAHWNKPASSYLVTIGHGAFGSFNLQVKDLPALFKVERVK
jgi:hypothetical protein